jgi:hypothetical protein
MLGYMKYIVVHNLYGTDFVYIFSENISHEDMANMVHAEKSIISAGLVMLNPKGITCYGESISLRVRSRGGFDAQLINQQLGA